MFILPLTWLIRVLSFLLNNFKKMKSIYLDEFIKQSQKKIAYVPLGTIEWHGRHLPIETDFMVAQKICEIISQKVNGYVLPPIYLGTDRERIKNNKKFVGMNAKLGKELEGSLYYLKPHVLFQMIECLVNSLKRQGFGSIYLITGHGGSKHIEVLRKIEEKYKNVFLFNPYKNTTVHAGHADEFETSLLWACYPDEEVKSKGIKIDKNDDFIRFQGYDAREKASMLIGEKMLNEIINNLTILIRHK